MPDASPERLPFEPRKKRPKPEGAATSGANASSKPSQGSTPKKSPPKPPTSAQSKSGKQKPEKSAVKAGGDRDRAIKQTRQDLAIPEVVSSRMIRRMVLLSGVPILFGVMTFLGSYYIVINDIFELPNTAVLLVSMGWFGLGVLGLSYGVISASWDEEASGSLVGWSEFTINFQRLVGAWQEARQKSLK